MTAPIIPHDFDPGIPRRFQRLVREYPGEETYPPSDFRVEWGPIFHRGRLDGTARVVVLGQDPATHEAIVRRALVGEAGQRVQGLLAKLGITRSYVLVNTFLYSVYGQGAANRHRDNPAIAAYRNQWLDRLLVGRSVDAVVTLGGLADRAFTQWRATPRGRAVDVFHQAIIHPTYPESASASGQMKKADAMARMLADWNTGLDALAPRVQPDEAPTGGRYGTALTDEDLGPIPERDLPPGTPPWMRALDAWAARLPTGRAAVPTATAATRAEAKRATIVVEIPPRLRPWARASP